MTNPRYQDILAKDIPEVTDDDGTRARIVVGDFWGKRGPVEGVAADPRYLDISVPPNKTKRIPVEASRHAFAYVFAGSGTFRDSSKPLPVQTELVGVSDDPTPSMLGNRSLVLFDGDEITVTAGDEVSGSCWSPAVRSKSRSRGGPDRDEHPRRDSAGLFRAAKGNVHQTQIASHAVKRVKK